MNKNVQIIACPPPNPELISAGKAACWVDETIFTLESDAFPKGDLILCANSKNYISNWQYLLKRLPNHAENAIWFVKPVLRYTTPLGCWGEKNSQTRDIINKFLYL